MSAKLRHRGRTATLRVARVTGTKLRLELPGRHTRRLAIGARVRLVLKVRARPAMAGCGYGPVKTLRLTTKLRRV